MRPVKTTLLTLSVSLLAVCADAADFKRGSVFESVEAFVAAAKEFNPESAKTDLSWLFTARDRGQPEDPKTGDPVPARSLESVAALWSDETASLVFATAAPPIEFSRCSVGVLFLLRRFNDRWHIVDHFQFTAVGKYAEVSAELTAGAGTGYRLGSEGMSPIVTVREAQGGRGYAYQLSASYTFRAFKLRRLDLE